MYASQHRMPELGDPGVSYEAQMGPIYYVLAAAVVDVTGGPGQTNAPVILRLAGVLLMPMLVILTYLIAREMRQDRKVSTRASVLICTTPLLIIVGASIQNDYLCFILIAVSLVVGMRLLAAAESSVLRHVGLGVLIGLAVLTKVVALALLPALGLAYLAHGAPLRRRAQWAVAAVGGVIATSGWWFLRNLWLYGDLTGANGISRLGITFPRLMWQSPGDLVAWLGNIVSYVYVPVEYFRNVLRSPAPLRIAAVVLAALSAASILALAIRHRSRLTPPFDDPARLFAVWSLVFTILGWVGFSFAVLNGAPRLAFHVAPVVAVLFAASTRSSTTRMVWLATVMVFGIADVWLARSAAEVSGLAFLFR